MYKSILNFFIAFTLPAREVDKFPFLKKSLIKILSALAAIVLAIGAWASVIFIIYCMGL